ncbi:MAG: DNA internalization-related competence protein ComEC/Rec2 [Rhodanobacteraceae bacterium]
MHGPVAIADRHWLCNELRIPRPTTGALLAVFAGALAVHLVPALPGEARDYVLLALAALLLPVRRVPTAIACVVLGFAWCALRADCAMLERLPSALEGQDIQVIGRIVGLPEPQGRSSRFDFRVLSASFRGHPIEFGGHVRLSWYDTAPILPPCSHWALTLRLKRPRGLINPGGFDFERYAAQSGIVATGYVRDDTLDRALFAGDGWCVDRLRLRISDAIASHVPAGPVTAVLQSLAVGDRRALDEFDWRVLRATGISHLVSISGLHIGLFAVFGALLARGLWKVFPRLTLRVPGPLLEAPAALVFACGYGLLAGLGVPTLRSLLMIGTALLARHLRRAQSVVRTLMLAALALVLWDPLALLAPGFWLSFAGVAVLLLILSPRAGNSPWWRELPRAQIALSVALLPLTVWLFGQASLVGPLANLVAVPWVSFVVVPLIVAAGFVLWFAPAIGISLVKLAWIALAPLWWLLERMAELPLAQVHFPQASWWSLLLALIGVIWCLAPRGVPVRWLGPVLLLPLVFPARDAPAAGDFEVLLLDVGQGLSVLVRTADHALIYDAGARYPSGFDLGDAVVVPALRALGIDRLDRLIISHGDNDHAGGARAVALAMKPRVSESGEPGRLAIPARQCVAGERWVWNQVQFRIVSPPTNLPAANNDRSCVLVVSSRHGSALLTGDISERIESTLPMALATISHPLLLIVPHHGSNTSSSDAFLDALRPDLALVSAGYRNRFRHPRPEVVARYAERSIVLFGTPRSGAIDVRVDGVRLVSARARVRRRAWWREP